MKGRLLDPARKHKLRIKRARTQESRTAKHLGGKLTPGSGNQWHSKGDVSTAEYLVENKDRTESKRYVLKKTDLRTFTLQAFKEGKTPVLQIDFGEDKYVVLRLEDWKNVD